MSTARPVIRNLAQLDDYGTLSDAAAGTPSLRTLGTAATQAAAGNHGHAASAITSGVLAMARLATGTPNGLKFVRDDGTLAVPAAGDPTMGGDLSGPASAAVVADDSHAHTTSTISGLDAADTTTGTFAVGRIPSITAAMVAADVATQAELDAAALLAAVLAPATSARNLITAGGATVTPLTLAGAASPTAPLLSFAAPTLNFGQGIAFQTLGGSRIFSIHEAEQDFNGTRDEGVFWGWNMKDLGAKRVSGENALWFGLEADYNNGAERLMEWNFDYLSAAGAGTLTRFMSCTINRATNKSNWVFVANEVGANSGFRIENVVNDKNFVFQPNVGGKQSYFTWIGGGFTDLVWGRDGTSVAPDSMSIGPSAQVDYNGVYMKKVSGSTQVCIGTSTPAAGALPARLTIDGGVLTVGQGASTGEYFNVGATPNDCILLAVLQTEAVSREGDTGISIAKNAYWQTQKIYANGVAQLTITPTAITPRDGQNYVLGTTTGTKIGTATTQKLGFWNATPVVQPAAYTQTYATATRTNANPTAVTLTDNTAGTANTTLELMAGAVYATDVVAIRNNFADLAAAVNALVADVANNKQLINALIDDKQVTGMCAP